MKAAAALAVALTWALAGCVVWRTDYEEAQARAERLRAQLEETEAERASLERDLEVLRERRELERSSLGRERAELLDEIEEKRQELARLESQLEAERELRRQREAEIAEIQASYSSLVEHLEDEVEAGLIEIHQLRGRLQVRALEQILFDSGSAAIKPQGREVLAHVAEELAKVPDHRIVVEGHTDDVPISTERYPSNWELSTARAARVARFLTDHGVDPELLSAVGRSEYEPIGDNDTAAGRARNRRIEIVLVPQG